MRDKQKNLRIFHVNMLKEWHLPTHVSYYNKATCPNAEKESNNEKLDGIPIIDYENQPAKVTINNDFSKEKTSQLNQLIEGYTDVIQARPGRTGTCSHRITTITEKPVREHPYRLLQSQIQTRKDEVMKMLEMDIIEPSRSEWASPVVLAVKPDGTERFCVDYRQLNAVSSFNAYPMPRVDFIATLGKASIYVHGRSH